MTLSEAERQVRAARAGLAAARAEKARLERRRLEHVCPHCLADMAVRHYDRVSVYWCRTDRFYRQVSGERV